MDIFFVISGYLITRIILSELQTKDSFSFLNFYERRARRILPMLFAVIFLSMPFAWVILSPSDLIELSQSIISSLFFGSNFFFYFNTTEYGADNALLKPFLHTWSLGVEEQFYLVFPIIAIITFKYFRAHFLTIIVALSLVSLQFAELMEGRNADLNFYLPFSRFWELAVGSALAYRELNYKPSEEGFVNRVLPMVGLYLVTYSVLFFNDKTPHPGFHTIVPILGVALIIGFASKDELVGKILGSKPFVWVGLISYSAYLWHFPIMAFMRSASSKIYLSSKDSGAIIVAIFFMSFFSYLLIERPFRNRQNLTAKKFWVIMFFASLTILAAAFSVIQQDGFPNRYPKYLQKSSFDDRFANLEIFDKCHRLRGEFAVERDEFCSLGEGSNDVFLIGDSHMVSIAFKLMEGLQQRDGKLFLMTRAGSLFGRNKKLDIARLDYLKGVADSTVIFGGYAHRENSEFFNSVRDQYVDLFNGLEERNNSVVIIYPIPSTNIQARGLKFEYIVNGRLLDKTSALQTFESESADAYSFYDSFSNDNISRIYPKDFLCDESTCFGVKDGRILISDIAHPSNLTAEWIVNKLFSELHWDVLDI